MRYRFGPYILDRVAGQLHRDGGEIELQPKSMALLCCFVQHPERLFSRTELLDEVWPDVVVSDHSLSQALFKLRQALEIPGSDHRWVQTVHGRGYRFVGEVAVDGDPSAESLVATPRHPFIGRSAELAQIDALWDQGHSGVALVGPGGQGKTRLALHHATTAARWPLAAFVDLVSADTPTAARAAVAHALGVPLGDDDPTAQLGRALAARGPALVVLDNLESVRDGVGPLLAAWQAAAPEVRWMLTSRERVRLAGIEVFVVPGLTSDDALELFVARAAARAVALDARWHEDIRRIGAHLEGQPLGIELAACRVGLLDPAAMHARLVASHHTLGTLPDGAPRHRSMHATLQWSWDHLDADAQRLLAALALFRSAFTVAQADAVFGSDTLDILDTLSDHFLVAPMRDAPGRIRLLEPVREFACTRTPDPEAVGRFVVAMDAVAQHPRPAWVDLPNLRGALSLAQDADQKVRLGLAVARMLTGQAQPVEAQQVLAYLPTDVAVALRDRVLQQRSSTSGLLGGDPELIPALRIAADAALDRNDDASASGLLSHLSHQATLDQRGEMSITAGEHAMDAATRAGDLEALVAAAYRTATGTLYVGEVERGRQAVARGLAAMRDHQDPCRRAAMLDIAATFDAHDGRGAHAVELQLQAIDILDEAGEVADRLHLLLNAASGMQETGRFQEALELQNDGYVWMREYGLQGPLAQLLSSRAVTHMHLGDLDRAEADLAEAGPLVSHANLRVLMAVNLAAVACLRGRDEEACAMADQAIANAPGHPIIEAAALLWRTLSDLGRGDRTAATAAVARAAELRQAGLPVMLLQSLDVVAAAVEGRPLWVHPDEHPLAHLAARAARRLRRSSKASEVATGG